MSDGERTLETCACAERREKDQKAMGREGRKKKIGGKTLRHRTPGFKYVDPHLKLWGSRSRGSGVWGGVGWGGWGPLLEVCVEGYILNFYVL